MAQFAHLFGPTLSGKNGPVSTTDVLSGKSHVMLYFSAHWCPPYRAFTPQLANSYETTGENIEVIFLSADRDEASFQSHFADMPWLALPYGNRSLFQELSVKYGVQEYPALIVLDGSDGNVITKDGRGELASFFGPANTADFGRGRTTQYVAQQLNATRCYQVVLYFVAILEMVVGALYVWAAGQVNGMPTKSQNESVWADWYTIGGWVHLIDGFAQFFMVGCIFDTFMEDMFKTYYYLKNKKESLALEQIVSISDKMYSDPKAATAGFVACCVVGPVSFFSFGWQIYGLALFCTDNYGPTSQYFAWGSIPSLVSWLTPRVSLACSGNTDATLREEFSDSEEE